MKVGTAVQLFLRGRVIASAVVDFIGGHGSVKKWGKMSVGSKKAIVTLRERCGTMRKGKEQLRKGKKSIKKLLMHKYICLYNLQ